MVWDDQKNAPVKDGTSASYDNTYEIVEFECEHDGWYILKFNATKKSEDQWPLQGVAYAWWQGHLIAKLPPPGKDPRPPGTAWPPGGLKPAPTPGDPWPKASPGDYKPKPDSGPGESSSEYDPGEFVYDPAGEGSSQELVSPAIQ